MPGGSGICGRKYFGSASGARRTSIAESLSHQPFERNAQGLRERFQHVNGEVLAPVLQPGKELVGDAGLACHLVLREALALAQLADKSPNDAFGVHFAFS